MKSWLLVIVLVLSNNIVFAQEAVEVVEPVVTENLDVVQADTDDSSAPVDSTETVESDAVEPVVEEVAKVATPDPKQVEALDFANGLFHRQMFDMALAEYKKFIGSYPSSELIADALLGQAECQFFASRYEESIVSYTSFLDQYPQSPQVSIAKLHLANARFLLEQYDQALADFEAIDPAPLDAEQKSLLYYFKAKSYQNKKDYEQAVTNFQESLKSLDQGEYAINALIALADISIEQEQLDEAVNYLDQALAKDPVAELKSFCLYKKGEIKFRQEKYQESIDVFRRVFKDFPKNDIRYDALANLMLAQLNMGNPQVVIDEYNSNTNALRPDGSFFKIYFIAANAYEKQKEYLKALEIIDKLLALKNISEEDKYNTLVKKSELLVKSKQFQKAVNWFSKQLVQSAIEQDRIYFLTAEAYYGDKKYNEALGLYQKLFDEFPESKMKSDALYGMAHTLSAMDQKQEAADKFAQYYDSVEDESKKREGLYNQILMTKEAGNVEQAISGINTYLTTFQDDEKISQLSIFLGKLYAEQNQHDQAIATFEQFIAQYPNDEKVGEARFLMAYNQQVTKDYEKALANYAIISKDESEKLLQYSALKNMALIYLDQKQSTEAAQHFSLLIKNFNKNDLDVQTYVWLAGVYVQDNKPDDALIIIQKLKERFTDQSVPIEAVYYEAKSLMLKKDHIKAIALYDQIIVDNSSSFVGAAKIEKGMSHKHNKEFDQAQALFEQAIAEHPDDNTMTMRSRFELAEIARELNNFDDAYKLYMLVAVLYSDDYYSPQSLFQAGQIAEQQSKTSEALTVYQEILNNYQGSEVFAKAQERVENLSEVQ